MFTLKHMLHLQSPAVDPQLKFIDVLKSPLKALSALKFPGYELWTFNSVVLLCDVNKAQYVYYCTYNMCFHCSKSRRHFRLNAKIIFPIPLYISNLVPTYWHRYSMCVYVRNRRGVQASLKWVYSLSLNFWCIHCHAKRQRFVGKLHFECWLPFSKPKCTCSKTSTNCIRCYKLRNAIKPTCLRHLINFIMTRSIPQALDLLNKRENYSFPIFILLLG